MRLLYTILSFSSAIYALYWINTNHPELKKKAMEYVQTGSINTLEVRYTAGQIMEAHRKDLLKDNRHRYLEPTLKFYPYLLLEVKYIVSDDKTKEGLILWDLTDGEMVIDTKAWEKTHGFGDCIIASTDRNEFKVINILAKKGGSCDRENLSKSLLVENDILDAWIDSLRRKRLIVQSGNKYRLHLQNPHLKTLPQTKIEEKLVTKPFHNVERVNKRHSLSQIEKITKAAFGNDFAIRKTTDIYLPVHCIIVQNPDGSIHTTHWNALNGKKLSQSHYID
jgi:hypothetical protein